MTSNQLRRFGIGVLGFKQWCDVVYVHRLAVKNCSPRDATPRQWELITRFKAAQRTVLRYHPQLAIDEPVDLRIDGVAKASSRCCDRTKYRLKLRWRSGNDAQDLGGGGLVFQQFLQFALAGCSAPNNRAFSIAITVWLAKISSN